MSSETRKKSQRKYHQSDKGKASKRRYQQSGNSKKVQRKADLKHKYQLTLEEFNNLLKKQDNRCAICNRELNIERKQDDRECICIDHNHITNKVRGILCYACNIGIGCFKDDPHLLLDAIYYLTKTIN